MNLKEVKKILRVLLRGITLGIDKYMFDICPKLAKYYKENEASDFYYCINSDERYHRMLIGIMHGKDLLGGWIFYQFTQLNL